MDDKIRSGISDYIGKRMFFQQAILSRYYPREPEKFSSFQWHHDAHGKKINVMILLTDVGINDQRMSYVKKSHKEYRNIEKCKNSRISDEEVNSLGLDIFECCGKAGDAFIFDSNGIHSGNRSLTKIRDSIIVQYNAGRYQWSFDIPKVIRKGLSLSSNQKKFLESNAKINWY